MLAGSGQMQKTLNRDRQQLDLTRLTPLKSAPPLLAFTTVALGGFRGLISNFLWIRANDLQQAGKYFEMVQLASWITDLEPHFPQVWAFSSLEHGLEHFGQFQGFLGPLALGGARRWNCCATTACATTLMSRSCISRLSWIFQSKMGQNMDDANLYYKEQWANEMMPFFGPNGTNFDELIHPQTPEARTRAGLLREKYKMDPVFAKQVDEEWGPLDWRVPEASAIYWAALGLEKARENPEKIVKPSDLTSLRRSIYQSMLQALYHGRLVINPFDKSYDYYPDLDLVSKLNDAYDTMYAEEPDAGQKQAIQNAHRNFLRDAVYFLYEDNRIAEAAKWFAYLGRKFPNQPLLDSDPGSLPSQLTLDQYAVACVQEDVKDIDQNRTMAAVEGLLARAYYELAMGEDNRYAGFKLLAGKIYERYQTQVASFQGQPRVGLPPLADINRTVLNQLLDPKQGMPFAARAVLRTQLRLPPETASTNAPPAAAVSTNTPETAEPNTANSVAK